MAMSMSPTPANGENFGLGNIIDKSQRNAPSLVVSGSNVELNRLELNAELNTNIENYEENNLANLENQNVDSDSEEGDGERGETKDGERGAVEREEDSSLLDVSITDMKNINCGSSNNNSSSDNAYDNSIEITNMTDSTLDLIGRNVNESRNHTVSNSSSGSSSSSSSTSITNAHHIVNTPVFSVPVTPRALLSSSVLINHNSAAVPVEDDMNSLNDRENLFLPYPTSSLTSTLNAQDIILTHKRNRSTRDEEI